MYSVTLTDYDEQYAPPESPVLRVDVVGDEAFLSIGTLEETYLSEYFEQTAQIKVDVASLIDALVAGQSDHARLHERRSNRRG
jgi:hypothetical protein